MAIVVSRSFFFECSYSDLCAFSFSLFLCPPPIRTRAFSSSLSRSVLLAPRSWLVRELGVVLSSCSFFFFPFFLSFSPFGGKVTPPKFDESKCARLARLDYYTRREAALCQAHWITYADERLKSERACDDWRWIVFLARSNCQSQRRDRALGKDGSKVSNSAGGRTVLEKSETVHHRSSK